MTRALTALSDRSQAPKARTLVTRPHRLCQCEVYRLVERQATAFLPGAVEGRVISRRDTGRGYAPVIAGPFTCGSGVPISARNRCVAPQMRAALSESRSEATTAASPSSE